MEDPMTDPTWNKDNPRWLRATVWASQFSAWGWQQAGYSADDFPDGHRRCAACNAGVPERRKQARCSKCKMVYFCNKDCQAKAHPIHKHCCLEPGLQKHRLTMQRLCEASGNEKAMKIDGEWMPPPSVLKLLETYEASEEPNIPVAKQYAAGFAALYLATCAADGDDMQDMAWGYLENAIAIAQRLRHHQLASDCMKEQLSLLKTFNPPDTDQTQLQICDKLIQFGERHEDIYLVAKANHTRAVLMMQQGLPGVETHVQTSKECWQDMMRASRLKEEAGEPGMMMACGRLVELVLDCAKERMSTKIADYAGAEALIQEADEYFELAGLDETKLLILMARANLYELQASAANPDFLEKAAEARQQLFVEMIEQEEDVSCQCAVCLQPLGPHRASDASKGPDGKILVNSCWHLFHKGCLKFCGEYGGCPDCHKPLWLSSRTLT